MKSINLRQIEPEDDFTLLAEWFTLLEGQVNTVAGLHKYYGENKDLIFSRLAVDDMGNKHGFYWGVRNRFHPQKAFLSLYVDPAFRKKGAGSALYAHMDAESIRLECKEYKCNVPDDCPEGLSFMLHRGYAETLHSIVMELDFRSFDDKPYQAIIERLKQEGFLFTTMEELGNTEDAQRKLYMFNDTAAMETPGWTGGHCWDTFEEFKKSVCDAQWYNPAGQKVVIDSATGDWVAMSAITRFEGSETAYNLFTGVNKHYRGRKLAQAVKVIALNFARDVLKVPGVRTNHNTFNEPMIAIDRKLGYVVLPGYFALEKKV